MYTVNAASGARRRLAADVRARVNAHGDRLASMAAPRSSRFASFAAYAECILANGDVGALRRLLQRLDKATP